MRKIVIDENIPYIKGVLESFFDVVYCKGVEIDSEIVKDASALVVRTRTQCNKKLLEASKVEFIGTTTIGFDHIDTQYCTKQAIEVATAAGCNARAVMQYVVSALVHISRTQGWTPTDKTIGIIGVGNVGSLVAEFARKVGFRVLCCDTPKMQEDSSLNYISIDELLKGSDIVTMHLPLNKDGEFKTSGMADAEFFSKMNSRSVFINSSRGSVVVDSALCEAIKSGRVSSAVIDVWNNEPEISRELLSLVTYSTPHIAGYSLQGKANGTAIIIKALSKHFGLETGDWYPESAPLQVMDYDINWKMLCDTIDHYYNIEGDSFTLRNNPEKFEALRNNYQYRCEYF